MIDLFSQRARRDYLLIPVMATPNGRLHLGHIAGPYLKMDILARHYQVLGDHALVISGTDWQDSFILLKAHETGEQPEQVCRRFHGQIERDLESLNIKCDAFIDPLSSQGADLVAPLHIDLLNRLMARGVTRTRSEKYLYCAPSDRYIVGCWLLGKCPECGNDAGSYFCEECGAHFQPELMREPRSRLEEGSLEWREAQCLYLQLSSSERLFSLMGRLGVPEKFCDIAIRHIKRYGPQIRLTQPGRWGITWPVPDGDVPQVVFNYSTFMAYALACGKVYGSLTGTGINAFDPSSGVTTVASFGIDNAAIFFIGCLGIALEDPSFKPFDHFLLNHFLSLEGSKFSTSRGHVIWAGDITAKTSLSSDAVRYYLALFDLERQAENLNLRAFVDFANNHLSERFQHSVNKAWEEINVDLRGGPPEGLINQLRRLLENQARSVDLRAFRLSESVRQIDAWVNDRAALAKNGRASYWWLKGLALLAYPIMPEFGAGTWQALGHESTPTALAFGEPVRPILSTQREFFRRISLSELEMCLPPGFEYSLAGP